MAVFDIIEAWYNRHRRHSAPGQLSPPQLRKETRLGRLSLKPETVHGKGTTPSLE